MDSFKPGNDLSGKCLSRRSFLGRIAAGTGGMLLTGCAGQKQKSLPNIVMIISDDQGWGDYGFMGHEAIETPHLDKLASESTVFTRGYVTAPLCCPSLASIITGLHPHQHTITSNDPAYDGIGSRYAPSQWSDERRQQREEMINRFEEVMTIPDILNDVGYVSLQTGKWWMGHYRSGGFTQGMTHGDMDQGGRHGDVGLAIGRETMEPIYDFVDQAGNRPFFIWYAPMLPHEPHDPSERLLNKYLGKTKSPYIARYWANCEWFDETCGDLLKVLDEKGVTNQTMILYVCDNGWIQQPDRNGYAEKSKRSPYEGGIRTPIMVKWPGHSAAGTNETTLVSSIDLAPTILRACGAESMDKMQGVDLLDTEALKQRQAVFGAAHTHDAVDINKPVSSLMYTCVIENEWKLIQPSGRNGTGTRPELYHVTEDPNESHDLAAVYPEKVEYMKTLIWEWWNEAIPE